MSKLLSYPRTDGIQPGLSCVFEMSENHFLETFSMGHVVNPWGSMGGVLFAAIDEATLTNNITGYSSCYFLSFSDLAFGKINLHESLWACVYPGERERD